MKFISANASNNDVVIFNKAVKNGDTVFVMFHSPSCGHCVHTLPIWMEIESLLADRYNHNDSVLVADIQDNVISKTSYEKQIEGFPTIWCISKKGEKIEPIESAKLLNPARTIDGFIEWIELKTPESYSSSIASSSEGKKKKKYRVTPYPRKKSRSHKGGKGKKGTRKKGRRY